MKRITANEILELIRSLPDADDHIYFFNGHWNVTNEWLCGTFCGRGFSAKKIEVAAEMLIDYLYRHIGHDSMVGREVTASGFPDLKKVKEYCMNKKTLHAGVS